MAGQARQVGLTLYNPEKAYHGYTLLVPKEDTGVYLLDMRGSIVHHWRMSARPGGHGVLLESGNLLFGAETEGAQSPWYGVLMEVDWEGNLLWTYADETLHHDFSRMPNGNTMLLGSEAVPEEVAKGIRGGRPGTEPAEGITCDYFREVNPKGETVWEWHAYEHLDPETDIICPLCPRHEWAHTNACHVLPDGGVLTSFRLLNTVGIVDRVSGAFLWQWGRDEMGGQHDPSLLVNGNILIFDNGWHSVSTGSSGSRVIEVDPKTNQVVWEYKTLPPWEFYSSFISGAQRLPNGNTLVCEGMTGRIFEVTREGENVWEYVNPFFGMNKRYGNVNRLFRAYRYAPDFPGLADKALDADKHRWLNHLRQTPG